MNKYLRKQISYGLFILSLLVFTGCGGSGGGTESLTGHITADNGTSLVGVDIVAMERSTNEKFRTTSLADGSYVLEVTDGVYDLGYDLDGYVTYFVGPINLYTGIEKDVVLTNSTGMLTSRIYGQVSLPDGSPATDWNVLFRSIVSPHTGDSSLITLDTVATDGTFDVALGGDNVSGYNHEFTLDLEYFDTDGTLVEFVDIAKLDRPCFVEMIVNTPVQNVLRHSDSTLEHTEQTANSRSKNSRSSNEEFVFDYTESQDSYSSGYFGGGADYWYGRLRPHGESHLATFSTNLGSQATAYSSQLLNAKSNDDFKKLYSDDDGNWWYDYAIHLEACNYTSNGTEEWRFRDGTDDTYTLKITKYSMKVIWHRVNYNSHHPDIHRIEYYIPNH